MKTKSKALLLTLCAVLLVAASVLGTMAYLTSTTEKVENTFSVGNVKITLDEAAVDENGIELVPSSRVTANKYKLMPGHTYKKDPTVHVASDSEDCYIRMKVEIVNYGKLLEKLGTDTLPEKFTDWEDGYWTCNDYQLIDGTAYLEFRHNGIITATDTIPALFTSITLPDEIEDMSGLEDIQILITAEAIQADGFSDAKTALDTLAAAAE